MKKRESLIFINPLMRIETRYLFGERKVCKSGGHWDPLDVAPESLLHRASPIFTVLHGEQVGTGVGTGTQTHGNPQTEGKAKVGISRANIVRICRNHWMSRENYGELTDAPESAMQENCYGLTRHYNDWVGSTAEAWTTVLVAMMECSLRQC
jgi:hypothetical protein